MCFGYSPIGITFLIATQIVSMADPGKELQRLMGYVITVLAGLAIHGLVVLPLLMIIVCPTASDQIEVVSVCSSQSHSLYMGNVASIGYGASDQLEFGDSSPEHQMCRREERR